MSYWRRLRPEEGGRFADPVGPDAETVARIRAADDCVVKRAPPKSVVAQVGDRVRLMVSHSNKSPQMRGALGCVTDLDRHSFFGPIRVLFDDGDASHFEAEHLERDFEVLK